MLKHRYETFQVFRNFYAEVKTQFSASLLILRSNNALEYTHFKFNSFCQSQSIIHQTMYSYASTHNGVSCMQK